MKATTKLIGLIALLFILNPSAFAQGTAFTYQGKLQNNGNPATGLYDFQFSLSNTPSGGSQIGSTLTVPAVGVTNGLFTTALDFGPVFSGNPTWLAISVRSNGVGSYVNLNPLQQLTPTPYALFADGASNLVGTVASGGLSGTYTSAVTFNNAGNSFSGNGSGLTGVNATTLGGLGVASLWQTTGNAGTSAGANFVGTSDNQPLELHVNSQRALRLELTSPDGPNIIGGYSNNFIGAGISSATIAGGGLGGFTNRITGSGYGGAIGGGRNNWVNSFNGVVSGGANNTAFENATSVGGGSENYAGGDHDTIGGGQYNTNYGDHATIGGGQNNNIQSGADSIIGGGINNSINAAWSTVGGGAGNSAGNIGSTVSGGVGNNASFLDTTVGGGYHDTASGYAATVGGGYQNVASGYYATVSGGQNNTNGSYANYAAIAGGLNNNAGANAEAIGGGEANSIGNYADHSIIGGGYSNSIGTITNVIQFAADHSAIVGGTDNSIFGSYNFIGGGSNNTAQGTSSYSVIGGGLGNSTANAYVTVGGGYQNTAGGSGSGYTTVGGGYQNNAGGTYTTVGGGANNTTSGAWSVVAGGYFNSASGTGAAVPGGVGNEATSAGSFAAGQDAQSVNSGAFVWSDGSATTTSSANNQFLARASGGFVFYTTSGSTGAQLPAGSGSWSSLSDRNNKNDFTPVNSKKVLAQVALLPLTTWSYKTEPGVRHVGPMAQDFYAAFSVGEDDRHIAEVDEGGVALAAIQGLNQKLEEARAENAELKARLDKLEQLLNSRLNGGER